MNWKVIDRLLLPAIFFLGAMLAALMLWVLLIFHQRAEIGATTAQQAVFVKTKTESELRDRILPLVRLAARWQTLDFRDTIVLTRLMSLIILKMPVKKLAILIIFSIQ